MREEVGDGGGERGAGSGAGDDERRMKPFPEAQNHLSYYIQTASET